ncbi:MAG: universal stress protein [Bacteroidetes bacterium]|jgi:nucleotide-binding universal stress UspA family protein|nr:universal stress protein [Bacteroidota bacterium]
MHDSIVSATDFSEASARALTFGADVAFRLDAALHVLHVVPGEGGYTTTPELPTHDEEQLRRNLTEQLDAVLPDEVAENEEPVQATKALVGSPNVADAVEQYATEVAAGLLVIGTHGRGGVRRLLLGSVAERLIRHTTRDVLAVRERARTGPVKHLLVPVDFSVHSKQAVRRGKQLAALYGARVSLLFVAEQRTVPVFSDTGLPSFTVQEMDDVIVENAPRALNALDAEVSVGSPHEKPPTKDFDDSTQGDAAIETAHHVRRGGVDEAIVDFVKEEAVDLIVMGSHGVSGTERKLLGNTTAQVLRNAPSPVYVVAATPASTG